jgi:hypothetical protein
MRKHNEEIYGIEYQRYTKDHLCTNGKVVKGGGGGKNKFFCCIKFKQGLSKFLENYMLK